LALSTAQSRSGPFTDFPRVGLGFFLFYLLSLSFLPLVLLFSSLGVFSLAVVLSDFFPSFGSSSRSMLFGSVKTETETALRGSILC
jgi:hypothetical protein